MRSYGIRIGVIFGFVLIYFLVLRPLRVEINKFIYSPVVEVSIESSEQIFSGVESSSVSNSVRWETNNTEKYLYINVALGLQFFISIIGFVIIGADKSFYFYLFNVQLLGSLLALLCLYLGSVTVVQLLIVTDLLVRYLIPLCSLGLVLLALIHKKQALDER
ncbi:MAG: hypothetical protein CL670_05685 [Balneola sp.]|jgi:hypothetical protein|nr:hypothetical protein [Balneola sp.]MBE78626.1 hypothetical protein [Balneola sp.]HBX67699.1 hypothetical protein [Balneolaceae bacterium]|tara:strand:- start:23772 stop:24257 length:486 start_codon:yes stop_codon:yes gene_type:complete